MQKILSIIFFILTFISFAAFDIVNKSKYKVLKVLDASEIVVDLNRNKKADNDETICVKDIEVFTANLDKNQEDLRKKYDISYEDAIKIGYLTDNFADDNLTDKEIKLKFDKKLKNINCKYADIKVNNASYRDMLVVSGFGIENGKLSEKFQSLLTKAKKQNLVILNHRSNKYHKLDCEYGKIANDTVILPKKQLQKNAIPCKFCHVDKKHKINYKKISFKTLPNYPTVLSSGSLKLYLTDFTTKLRPDRNCDSLACRDVLSQINNSKTSIDIALYGFDNIEKFTSAIKSAKDRGVKLRVVYDISNKSYYPETEYLLRLADKKSGDGTKSLMHNKFIIIDNKTLITGSMNFSSTGFSGFNGNSLLVIHSEDLAKMYKEEFEQMLSGKFSQNKSKISTKRINLNNTYITPAFSPKNQAITTNILPLINNAKSYIYMPVFVLTHTKLANALIDAKNRGVDVKIIVDATGVSSTASKVKLLRDNKIPLKVENYAGKIHSKSIIIDDKYVITGSMNFSNSGEYKNDENMLIIEDEKLANFYKGYFEYIWTKIPNKYLYRNVRAEGRESIGSCSDGIDNNYDGKIDMDDDACKVK